jgi:peptidase M23-like protein
MRKLFRPPVRPARRFWWRAMALALVVGVCLSWALTAGAAQTTARVGQPPRPAASAGAVGGIQTTALAVQATTARAVYGSDGRVHIDYDLLATNAFTAPVTLQSIQVRGAGRVLLTLRGRALAAHTFTLPGTAPAATIPVASVVKTLVDVRLPRSFGRTWPRWLTHVIRYRLPASAPVRVVIASTVVRAPAIRVSGAPIRIAPPLRGPGWINANGCCGDPTSEHRRLLLPSNGSYRTPEIFAIDWSQEVHGRFFTGDGKQNTDWPCYGRPIHAVAGGVVVSAINNRPEAPPFTSTADNHTLHGPADFSGNSVIERIARGVYASYAHMQTGSVRVRAGQRLRAGEVIGLLGNSGNTNGPHLHFGIVDRADFWSDSLPFTFGSLIVQGMAAPGPKPGTVKITGQPRRVTRAEPLISTVSNFGR